jgi:hypothetical protein
LVTAESYHTKGFSILAVLQESIAAVETSAREEFGESRPIATAAGRPESGSLSEPSSRRGSENQTAGLGTTGSTATDIDGADRLFECGWSWGIDAGARAMDPTEPVAAGKGGDDTVRLPQQHQRRPAYNIPFIGRDVLRETLSAALDGSGNQTSLSAADFEKHHSDRGSRLPQIHFIGPQLVPERLPLQREIKESEARLRALLQGRGLAAMPESVTPQAQAKKPTAQRGRGHGRTRPARRKGRHR